ncbi:Ribosomal S24E family protein [Quillaja saponaria]|uniref:Ribosomal S24E family protein n=1 Tax=Quillaja saponaria TaxID=32244 RepID=A0AAD7Q0A3_QUISA|nr:Ribosomal S24E family protein [Quillaja saponaria]
MSLLRAALRSKSSSFTPKPGHGLPFLRESPRRFSTEAEQPSQDTTVDQIFRTTNTGLAYGRLQGINRYTLKTDIINTLEGCDLTLDDVKVDYSRLYAPLAMMIQFPSHSAYDYALKVIARKGRLYKLERADRGQWDFIAPYDGKTVLLQGIPRNAIPDDVERFLSGCDYDSSSLNLFLRAGFPDPVKVATIRFRSKTEAMNAFITKNRGFILNNQISLRVLQ